MSVPRPDALTTGPSTRGPARRVTLGVRGRLFWPYIQDPPAVVTSAI